MNAITSAVLTSVGSVPVNSKNTFRSNPVANTVFGRQRAATHLDPGLTETALLEHRHKTGHERASQKPTGRPRDAGQENQ